MISVPRWNILSLKIQSLVSTLSLVLFVLLISEVGSYNSASYDDGSNQNGNSPFCRVVRDNRKSLLNSFNEKYTASSSQCDISSHCTNVSCSAEFSRGQLNAGLVLKLCEPDPELDYWVDLPGQWDESWVHTFSSKNASGQVQRVEIKGNHNGTTSQAKPTKWFIEVIFSITSGRIQINSAIKHISLQSVLKICQNGVENKCTNTTLLNFPRMSQEQICYFDDEKSSNLPHNENENRGSYLVSSSRSSRNANANAWNPEELHRSAAERAKKFENGRLLPIRGDKCDPAEIFGCGPGATCHASSELDNFGECLCLPDYTANATGHCVKISPSSAPLAPSNSSSDSDSRSYSSAVGAIISILILVTIAAGIFFGTKYHYFSRLRHRIPVLRCWPFRRHQPWEDNVTMVNPLGPPDDDDPPLL